MIEVQNLLTIEMALRSCVFALSRSTFAKDAPYTFKTPQAPIDRCCYASAFFSTLPVNDRVICPKTRMISPLNRKIWPSF